MSIILDDNISPQAESLDRISAMQAQEVIFKSGLEYCNKVVKELLDRADGEDGTITKALCKEILIGTAEKLNYLKQGPMELIANLPNDVIAIATEHKQALFD